MYEEDVQNRDNCVCGFGCFVDCWFWFGGVGCFGCFCYWYAYFAKRCCCRYCLVVYDPGLSGGAKDAATKIGYNLQTAGYTVVLAGVKSSTAANVSGYGVVVVGGPIYAGSASSSVKAYLMGLSVVAGTKVGVFGYGSVSVDDSGVLDEVAPLPSTSSLTFDAAAKIVSGSMDEECSEFVAELLS